MRRREDGTGEEMRNALGLASAWEKAGSEYGENTPFMKPFQELLRLDPC